METPGPTLTKLYFFFLQTFHYPKLQWKIAKVQKHVQQILASDPPALVSCGATLAELLALLLLFTPIQLRVEELWVLLVTAFLYGEREREKKPHFVIEVRKELKTKV